MNDKVCFTPIGYVYTSYSDEDVKRSFTGVDGYVEVLEEYSECLKGLEGFSHIIVVAYLHNIPIGATEVKVVKPRRLLRLGLSTEELPEVGVFATDSPHRPNPIAISILEVVKIEGRRIHVKGLDLFNGTPILDIKPYTISRAIEKERLRFPFWYSDLLKKIEERASDVKEI
ncbi:MAG: tRNA (N6-threonylcarbamoyladenosine(37)-N6)-methyltransferase TrmO [Infirmifilum sp.]